MIKVKEFKGKCVGCATDLDLKKHNVALSTVLSFTERGAKEFDGKLECPQCCTDMFFFTDKKTGKTMIEFDDGEDDPRLVPSLLKAARSIQRLTQYQFEHMEKQGNAGKPITLLEKKFDYLLDLSHRLLEDLRMARGYSEFACKEIKRKQKALERITAMETLHSAARIRGQLSLCRRIAGAAAKSPFDPAN